MKIPAVLNETTFWYYVQKTDKCWLWTAARNRRGYGYFNLKIDKSNYKTVSAHRLSYHLAKGAIPEGLTLDHLCRNHSCVNPEHLEPVTNKENILRGSGACAINNRKTHCKRGHEFREGNIIHSKGKGHRRCRTCQRIHGLNYWRRENGRPEKSF